MKKFLLAAVVVIGLGVYSFVFHRGSDTPVVAPKTTAKTSSGSSSSTSTSSSSSGSTATTAAYKDGTYTGSEANAFYGTIQVQATISGGKLTDVQFLQYPNDRPNSVSVNQQAMPLLKQEAIAAQSAQVDAVTGATDTSQAFVQSLGSALSQAKA
jgi:uncharacterized protein with FMN-binding domain